MSLAADPGALVGGALGWLVGVGLLAIPGLEPVIAAGPIMAILAGVGVGGTVGSIVGSLIGLGMPEYEASTLRRPHQRGRHSSFGPLRQFGMGEARRGAVEEQWAPTMSHQPGEASADFLVADKPSPRSTTQAH